MKKLHELGDLNPTNTPAENDQRAELLQTLADAQALNGTDKQSGAGAIIVLVALKLLSSPA